MVDLGRITVLLLICLLLGCDSRSGEQILIESSRSPLGGLGIIWCKPLVGDSVLSGPLTVSIREDIDSGELTQILQCDRISHLTMRRQALKQQHIEAIARLPNLSRIRVVESRFESSLFDILNSWECEEIYITGFFDEREEPPPAIQLPACRELTVQAWPPLTDRDIDWISKRFRNVEDLDIRGARATSYGFLCLSECSRLKSLDLSYTTASRDCFIRLSRLHSLEKLRLAHVRIENEDALYLFDIVSLKMLGLYDTGVSDSVKKAFEEKRNVTLIR